LTLDTSEESIVNTVIRASEELATLPFPPIVWAGFFALGFIILAVAVVANRDVAHRNPRRGNSDTHH
jgi:hypothetical protein